MKKHDEISDSMKSVKLIDGTEVPISRDLVEAAFRLPLSDIALIPPITMEYARVSSGLGDGPRSRSAVDQINGIIKWATEMTR